MIPRSQLAHSTDPLVRVRAHFGLSQAQLGRLLGVSQSQIGQEEANLRPMPSDAYFRLRKLLPLLTAPPAAPPLDPAPLQLRLAFCRTKALNLEYQLRYELADRAAVAANCLTAAETLPAALAATQQEAPLTARQLRDQQWQLENLLMKARHELAERSGPTPTALLRARLAGLRAEAEALTQLLAEAGAPPNDAAGAV